MSNRYIELTSNNYEYNNLCKNKEKCFNYIIIYILC